MTLGEFLQQIIEYLYELWPIRIVKVWEQGVRLRTGNPTGLLTSENGWFGSGIHAFWPIIGEITKEDVESRTIETRWQTLDTKDDHSVSFSLAARYRIRDLVKHVTQIQEQEETVQNQLSAAAAEAIQGLNLDELDSRFAESVKDVAKVRLSRWGVTLLEVSLFNRVGANTLRLIQE